MAVGDVTTSTLSFSWPSKEVSKPPHEPKPPKPVPPRPPRKVYVNTTEYAKADIEASTPTINPEENCPFLLGRQRQFRPQVLWYGNYRTKYEKETREETTQTTERIPLAYNEWEEREVITTKNVTTYTPVDFYITVVLGLCLGPRVRLKAIYAGDEKIWDSAVSGETNEFARTTLTMNRGAPFSTAYFHPGENIQDPDDYLVSLLGPTTTIGFNGTCYIVIPTIASKDYGNASLSYEIERVKFNRHLLPDIDTDVTNGSGDINAAEFIWQIIRSDWSALAVPITYIDETSFRDYYDKCATRNFYFSMLEAQEDFGTGYLETVMGLTNSVLYVDMEAEVIKINEFFNLDYDPDLAITFDPSNVKHVQELERPDWNTVPTHFELSYTSRKDNYKKKTLYRMSRSINTDDKRSERREVSVSAALACERPTAIKLLWRLIMRNGVPVANISLEVNSDGNKVAPADSFKLTWPAFGPGFVNVPFFCTNRKISDPELNTIVLEGYYFLRPDIDDFEDDLDDTDWTRDYTQPTTPVNAVIVSDGLPVNLLRRMGIVRVYSSFKNKFSSYGVALVRAENDAQIAVNVYRHSNGALVKRDMPYAASGKLAADLPRSFRADDGYLGTLDLTDCTLMHYVDDEGGIGYCNGEWFGFKTAINLGSGNWRLTDVERGLWGFEMQNHLEDDVFYMIDDSSRLLGPFDVGDVRNYDFVSAAFSGRGEWPTDALSVPVTFAENVNTMNPPVKVRINGNRWYPDDGPVTIYFDTDYEISWINRYRKTQAKIGISDDQSKYEVMVDADDRYSCELIDALDEHDWFGVTGLPFNSGVTFDFDKMTFHIVSAISALTAGTATIWLTHQLASAQSKPIQIPVILADLPGVVADLKLDNRVGLAAELTTAYAIIN